MKNRLAQLKPDAKATRTIGEDAMRVRTSLAEMTGTDGEQAECERLERMRMRRALELFGCYATDEYAGKVIRAITNAGPLELGIREVPGHATAARSLNERPDRSDRIGYWATALAVGWMVGVSLGVAGCL